MPTLDWIGKKAVVNHHREVPYRLLHCDKAKSAGDPDAGNLLVQGDNLEALKALLPYYAGRVKCIYIDPPYNTGNEGWIYNDNVNSPEIKAWLGKTVGKEAEDLSRHDKWLCMMYPRLRLLREFLDDDGILFVSIDDIEARFLRIILDDIFHPTNFIAQLIWKSRQNKDNRNVTGVSVDHEYVLAYGAPLRGEDRKIEQYTNADGDLRGPWVSGNMVGLATADRRPNLHFDLIDPETKINYGCPAMGWRFDRKRIAQMISEGRILWPTSSSGRPRQKAFLYEIQQKYTGFSSLVGEGVYTRDGTKDIDKIFGERVFEFPKPVALIKQLLKQATPEGGLVLDSFAGSGTTAQAALELAEEDSVSRNFVLVEMNAKVIEDVARKRLESVSKSSGSGFRFCTLGEPLFDEQGSVDAAVTFPNLAAHIFFCETGSPIPKRAEGKTPFIGTFRGRAIYLLYAPDLMGIASEEAGNVLTADLLDRLPVPDEGFEGVRVVYAEGCTIPDDVLRERAVTFKQVPYQIEGP
ncbi:MAG TPA: site-specific DNA-methyltransferase [Rhizomicrobium sp.]|jgi:site-specific DNA-methyltransferase (adenine-specific)/adenine-specific DNA-methyltransferase